MSESSLHPANKKILVAGDVLGKFTKLYKRLKVILILIYLLMVVFVNFN